MEHYRSTLATTACAVFGLVAAAHILHPGNYEVQTRPARPAVVAAAAAAPTGPAAWVDPPARLAGPETTGALAAAAPAPRIAAAIPAAALPADPLPAEMARSVEPPRKKAAHRLVRVERGQHRTARFRRDAIDRTAQADRAAAAAAAPPPAQAAASRSERIDPIGDIIRGLGFGRDS
jgi:hypothetical protein